MSFDKRKIVDAKGHLIGRLAEAISRDILGGGRVVSGKNEYAS
jgi:ribosomal protein L13